MNINEWLVREALGWSIRNDPGPGLPEVFFCGRQIPKISDKVPISLVYHILSTRPGKLTVCCWKYGPVEIVDLPIDSMVMFHSFLYFFQRVDIFGYDMAVLGSFGEAWLLDRTAMRSKSFWSFLLGLSGWLVVSLKKSPVDRWWISCHYLYTSIYIYLQGFNQGGAGFRNHAQYVQSLHSLSTIAWTLNIYPPWCVFFCGGEDLDESCVTCTSHFSASNSFTQIECHDMMEKPNFEWDNIGDYTIWSIRKKRT